MEENAVEVFRALLSVIPRDTEFRSAIAGAVVGGFIAYFVQVKALREGKKQRDEDHKRVQQALGTALFFKLASIHSNISHIHRHIEGCFEEAARRGLNGDPWQFFQPLANLPHPVQFSSDEMGMLLSLKSDDVFNLVVSMDAIHNGLIDATKVLNTERRALTERLRADKAEGNVLRGVLDKDQFLALRPHMIEVNSLVDGVRANAKEGLEESREALDHLQMVLRDKLGLAYKFTSKVKPKDSPVP